VVQSFKCTLQALVTIPIDVHSNDHKKALFWIFLLGTMLRCRKTTTGHWQVEKVYTVCATLYNVLLLLLLLMSDGVLNKKYEVSTYSSMLQAVQIECCYATDS